MKSTLLFLLLIARSAPTAGGADESRRERERSPFQIVVDAGSTGTRLHVFESTATDSKREVIRRVSEKARVPLANFARSPSEIAEGVPLDPDAVVAHLVPLFATAADAIPREHRAATRVLFLGTAGMRTVEEGEQTSIYDAVHDGLRRSAIRDAGFPFEEMRRKNFGTFRGTHEGFFAGVTVNYLAGAVDEDAAYRPGERPLGALDMGGSSAQIVLPPTSPHASLRMNDFYSVSHLGYGVDPVRERLFDGWVEECAREGANCTGSAIGNPCAFPGQITEWRGYRLLGEGDSKSCSAQIAPLISSLDEFSPPTEAFHPPSKANFYAMSNYFFVLDSLRELSSDELVNAAWPTPSINELDGALDAMCSRKWQGDLEEVKDSVHKYTSGDLLPTRCLEAVYIVNMLRDGYGLDPTLRNIVYTYDIGGNEIEWTFGLATWRFARERSKMSASL